MASLVGGILQLASASLGPLLWPTYVHLLVLGWLTQLIFGVAFWMFPRQSPEAPRGSERLAWVSLLLLNLGVWAAGLGQTFGVPGLALGGRVAEMLAALSFASQLWSRARGSSAAGQILVRRLTGDPDVRSP